MGSITEELEFVDKTTDNSESNIGSLVEVADFDEKYVPVNIQYFEPIELPTFYFEYDQEAMGDITAVTSKEIHRHGG